VALVVCCGIATFVTMLCVYHSLMIARDGYYAAYRFADVFVRLKRAPGSLAAELREIPGVALVDTRVLEDVVLTVPGLDEPATGRLISLPAAAAPMLNALALTHGRLPAGTRPAEVVASEAFAEANHLAVGNRLGAILNGRWTELNIVGTALSPEYVYEVSPSMIFPDNRRFGVLWMSHDVLATAFNMKNAFNDVAVSLAHGASARDVADRLNVLLAPYGGLNAYDRSEQASNRFLTDELGEIRVNATYLPAIFLAVSAFLVYTLLSRLVSIQRGQIALLKAFGYANTRIGAHFLEFAMLVVGTGLVLGVAASLYLGRMLIDIYRAYFHFPALRFQLSPLVVSWAVICAASAALLGSMAAVSRAVRLPPAEGMRPEAPKTYRAGLLESTGLMRMLGMTGRAIGRNIARRPWRAALSITGIVTAVATVVVGRFTFDAVNHLMRVQFDFVERQDATVTLNEARSSSALLELQRLPGVLQAEAFRAVPVRLQLGHHLKQSVILGLSRDADLRQIIDARRHRVDLPPAGLVLTRKLGEILRAHPGDTLDIEQLDGRRLRFSEPIAKLSDEPLGVSAYMDARALARTLQEANEISGVFMQVDRSREPALYRELRRTPVVSSVALRSAMLTTARETMDRSFIIMTIVMTVFAAILVVGVVYNSARISLSERGSELASLRVLGFRNSEVTALLLGEQALLTVIALPLGCALGATICRLLAPLFDRELFRLPFVFSARTFAFAALVTLGAAVFSCGLIIARIRTLDLVAVLKSRE
jgi:putative ABC transport system permease protein